MSDRFDGYLHALGVAGPEDLGLPRCSPVPAIRRLQSRPKWQRESGDHHFIAHGVGVVAVVFLDTDYGSWCAAVHVHGRRTHSSEHGARDEAMCAAEDAAERACEIRAFDEHPPRWSAPQS